MPKSQQQRPFSIRIFVADGDPDGLRLVEKSNWTGVGVVFNRTNYRQAVTRAEFQRTGVYVLVGASEDSSLPTIYVGEGDPVKDRLNQHHSKKDFWTWTVFFVSKDNSLNKAHVQHLEAKLLQLAKEAKQCNLDNTQQPLPPTLSEAETADVESYLLAESCCCRAEWCPSVRGGPHCHRVKSFESVNLELPYIAASTTNNRSHLLR